MSKVTVQLPSLLAPIVNGSQSLTVEADSVKTALEALVARQAEVGVGDSVRIEPD